MNTHLNLVPNNRRWAWRLIPLFLLLVTLGCKGPGPGEQTATLPPSATPPATPTARPTPTREVLPPMILVSNPPPGSEIALDKPVTLVFNQPMKAESVAAAINQDGVNVQLSWKDASTLQLVPGAPLQPDQDVQFKIEAGAQSANGQALAETFQVQYRTTGYLRLTQALPENGTIDLDPTSAIVASFNRPVVALGADPATMPSPLTIQTADGSQPAGSGEWVNTSTYVFYPQPALAGGQTYTVQVDADLRSAEGGPLDASGPQALPTTWQFSTALPIVDAITASENGQPAGLDQPVIVSFNQPMDPASVEASFTLNSVNGVPVSGSFEWNADHSEVTFTPDNLLARGTEYYAQVSEGARAAGGTPIERPAGMSLVTVPEPGVRATEPGPGQTLSPYSSVIVYFNSPLLPEQIKPYLSFDPPVEQFDVWWDAEQRALNIYPTIIGGFSPSTDYRLNISADLPDQWGAQLGQSYTLPFSTPALPASIDLGTSTYVQFIAAGDPALVAQVTNQFNLNLTVGSISLPEFFQLSAPGSYDARQGYRPADALSWTQSLDIPQNRSTPAEIYLNPGRTPLPNGLYFLRVADLYPSLLVVSDVNLVYKQGPTDALVWATRLSSGEVLAGLPVTLYDQYGAPIANGLTDEQGVLRTNIPIQPDPYAYTYAVTGEPGSADFSLALPAWDAGVAPWDFGVTSWPRPPHLQAYLYTDRPIYRPGQTVYFRAVVREAFNGRYSPPGIASLPVTLSGGNNYQVQMDLPLNAFGSAHGEFALPVDMLPGMYSLYTGEIESNYLSFTVANYRKPEINLQVRFNQDEFLSGMALEAVVDARYFFDAPAGNVPVRWELTVNRESLYLPGYRNGIEDTSWLQAYRYPNFGGGGYYLFNGEGRTGPDGTLALGFSSDQLTQALQGASINTSERLRFTLQATATDETGLPVSARGKAWMHPGAFYIGARPTEWLGQSGVPASFEFLAAGWDGKPAGQHSLRVDFQKVVFIEGPAAPGTFPPQPTFTPQFTMISTAEVTTDSSGNGTAQFTPPEAGTYWITVYGTGPDEGSVRTEILFWVAGSGQIAWPNIPNSRLQLLADKQGYLPGETAQVFLPNPYGRELPALVSIERGTILRHQVLTVPAGGTSFSLPLSSDDAPNVFVSYTLLNLAQGLENSFRQGLIELQVEPIEQTLNVQVTSQPQRAGPGENVTIELRVTDSAGQPVQGEFSLAVVDLAVLALAEPNSTDLVTAFYSPQPLGIRTGVSLAAWPRRLIIQPEGGGGGGGDGGAVPALREDFPDTAYWNAEIITGADGRATLSLQLPDNLTTWQIDVRGLTSEMRVGQGEAQIITSKELIIRPVAPRFLVAGDHAQLAAVVQNNTPAAIQATVTLEGGGLILDNPAGAIQQVTVPANGRVRVEWWGTVGDVATADLRFRAEGGGLQDAVRLAGGALPVLRYANPQAYRTAGTLDQADELLEVVSLPLLAAQLPGGPFGSLDVELSPSLSAAMLQALDVLEGYPYDCTEQILSRFLPNLELYRLLRDTGLQSPELQARLERTLAENLGLLAARQNQDGGWSWWATTADPLYLNYESPASDPYITAYVVFGMARARQAGTAINEFSMQRALDYLLASLPAPDMLQSGWQYERLAFISLALVEAGVRDFAGPQQLYDQRSLLSPWAQASLALVLETLTPGSDRAQTLLSDLESGAGRIATGAFWESGVSAGQDNPELRANLVDGLTNSAIVTYVLARQSPESPLLADAVRFLVAQRGANGAWPSTYSTAWTLMALTETMRATGELGGNFNFNASLNGKPLATGQAAPGQLNAVRAGVPLSELFLDTPNALRIGRGPGSGRLYYTVQLLASEPAESAQPLNRGLSISRAYYPAVCPSGGCEPLASARPGDKVTVRLTLNVPKEGYHLLVEDYIPAGSEILDTRLKTSQLSQDFTYDPETGEVIPQQHYDPRDPFAGGWGWWLFGEARLYDDHIAWAAEYLPAGTYELTYTLVILQPGEYRVLPARAWQFYFPEVQGASAGSIFNIQP